MTQIARMGKRNHEETCAPAGFDTFSLPDLSVPSVTSVVLFVRFFLAGVISAQPPADGDVCRLGPPKGARQWTIHLSGPDPNCSRAKKVRGPVSGFGKSG